MTPRLRRALAWASCLGCLALLCASGLDSLARVYYTSGGAGVSAHYAERASRLSPRDPSARYVLAGVFLDRGELGRAAEEYRKAASLRPRHAFLWQELGYALLVAGDYAGALEAYQKAAKLAPRAGEPRWRMGEALLLSGRREEGFAEMRAAAVYDPAWLADLVEKASEEYAGDAAKIVGAVAPRDDRARLALARALLRGGHVGEASGLVKVGGAGTARGWQDFLAELLEAKHFAEAYEVWLMNGGAAGAGGRGGLIDGGFEGEITLDNRWFGWRVGRQSEGLSISLDGNAPYEGRQSLRVDFGGEPGAAALSQLHLIDPSATYRLRFAARTRDLKTGAPPLLSVADAASGRKLGSSKPLAEGTSGWSDYEVEVTTGPDTKAVVVKLQNAGCRFSTCPTFGHVWLDGLAWQRRD